MIARLIHTILDVSFRLLLSILYWLLGTLISVTIRLGPIFFRLSVIFTTWALALMDILLKGRLATRVGVTYIASGGLWAVIGCMAPILIFGRLPLLFILLCLSGGFGYGLICAFRVRRLPGWGMWVNGDGLPLGDGP